MQFTRIPNIGIVRSNITIRWSVSEDHVDFCSLRNLLVDDSSATSSVECPDSVWRSGAMEEGEYQLEVTTQDVKNNTAVWESNFVVDQTPPRIFFNHTPSIR